MSALILDGKDLASRVREDLAGQIAQLRQEAGIVPGLAVILVGDDPASQVYVRNKLRACEQVGINARLHHLPADSTQEAVAGTIQACNDDPSVHGILLQWPVPAGLDYRALIEMISPAKDVDGFHPINGGYLMAGEPRFISCTPLGIMHMLEAYDIDVAGKHAVVVGRSLIVGRPMALLLLAQDATVTICHSQTRDLSQHTRQADILVVAVGRPKMIGAGDVKPGVTVIDVGINRLDDGSLVGDVDTQAIAQVAGAITPVPGGVGPMTVAMLLKNTVEAARWTIQASSASQSSPGR